MKKKDFPKTMLEKLKVIRHGIGFNINSDNDPFITPK